MELTPAPVTLTGPKPELELAFGLVGAKVKVDFGLASAVCMIP